MEDSEAGSDADEEKDVEEVEAVEAKPPTPEPSAPPSPERALPRRRIREPVDLGTALGPDWDPEAPAKVETFDALKRVFDEADEDSDGELGVDDFVKAFRHLDPELRDAREALRRARSEARSDSYADAGQRERGRRRGSPARRERRRGGGARRFSGRGPRAGGGGGLPHAPPVRHHGHQRGGHRGLGRVLDARHVDGEGDAR
jgi:hypothetical protein